MEPFDPQNDAQRDITPAYKKYPEPEVIPAARKGFFTTPLSRQGWPIWAVYIASLIGLVYLLNPGAGFIELLPDNLPLVGNLDEGAAFMLIWFGLMEYFEGRKHPPIDPS